MLDLREDAIPKGFTKCLRCNGTGTTPPNAIGATLQCGSCDGDGFIEAPRPKPRVMKTKEDSPLLRHQHEQICLAQHKSDSFEHYTPSLIAIATKELFGGPINLDPASSWLANQTIVAEHWFGLQRDNTITDGLVQPWSGNVFLNPPGGHTWKHRPEIKGISRSYAMVWWGKLVSEYLAGNVKQALFVAFSLEQLVTSQSPKLPKPLTAFPMVIPDNRIRFFYPTDTREGLPLPDTDISEGTEPTHGNALVYLPPRDDLRDEWGSWVQGARDELAAFASSVGGQVLLPL